MKVTEGIGYEANKYIDKTTANQEVGPDKQAVQASTTQSDTVNLSEASKAVQLAQKAVAETPDIRTEKVEAIKAEVDNNTYEVEYDKVAEKIVGAILDDFA